MSMAMQISPVGLNLIKESEGLRLQVYGDAVGLPTIGYGHLLKPGEHFSAGITESQADELLNADVEVAAAVVNSYVKVPLNQNQFDALVDFVFNLGSANFRKSTLLKKLNAKDFVGAAGEFGRWVYAGGHPLPGLIARREAERELFLKSV
jgi:lysozyme